MALSGIELVAQNTGEISAGIKDVIKQLQALENQTAKAKPLNLMDQVFGGKKNFDNFIASLNQLNKGQAAGFKRIAEGFDILSKSVKNTSNLRQAALDLEFFMITLTGFSSVIFTPLLNA